jgi:hypothetical protein
MGWGQGGEMNQALYAHMNNKRKMKKKSPPFIPSHFFFPLLKTTSIGFIIL